jgi:hypothetical protein
MDLKLRSSSVRITCLLLMLGLAGCGAEEVASSQAPLTVANAASVSSPDRTRPVPTVPERPLPKRSVPTGLTVKPGWIPEDYVESQSQDVMFSLSEGGVESPGLSRTWISKSLSPENLGYFIILAEKRNPSNLSLSSEGLIGAHERSGLRPAGVVSILLENGKWDLRWQEKDADLRVIVSGGDWTESNVERLVAKLEISVE